MMTVEYDPTERTATLEASNGAIITASNIVKGRDGGISASIRVDSAEGVLGAGHVSLGDALRRASFAQTLAGSDGLTPEEWTTDLTVLYLGIESALSSIASGLRLADAGVIDVSGEEEPGPRLETVQGIIPYGKITSLFAEGGTAKSYFASLICQVVAQGHRLVGDLETIAGDCLFLDFEDDSDEFVRRSYEIARGLGLEAPPAGLFYRRCVRPLAEMFTDVLTYIETSGISLVVVDSFGAACAGESEGSRDSIALMQLLQRLPCTVLLIDHEPKAKDKRGPTQFGSVYKRNLSRSQLHLEDRGWPEPNRHALMLRHTKLNSGPLRGALPLYVDFDQGTVSFREADPSDEAFQDAQGVEGMVLSALRELGQSTKKEIVEHTGANAPSVSNTLSKLKARHTIMVVGNQNRAFVYQINAKDYTE